MQASGSESALVASRLFARRYRLSLEELADLFEDSHWKDSSRGGNRWFEITQSVIELDKALDEGDAKQSALLLKRMLAMCHNNGRVGDKLNDLDESL